MRATCDCGMTALEKEKKIDEFGGCTMMSAPTPSARARQSLKIPDVKPTIRRIKNTCRPIAAALNARGVRTARGGAWHSTTVRNLLQRELAR